MADGSREARFDPKQMNDLTYNSLESSDDHTKKCSGDTFGGERVKLSFYVELDASGTCGKSERGVVANAAGESAGTGNGNDTREDRKKRCFDRYDSSESSDRNYAITPEQQIVMALEFYACGSFQRCIGDAAGVHKSSVCRIIHRVSRAIAGLRSNWVSMPQNIQEMETEAKKFYEISAFPKVIGTIDCTHIPIKSPGGEDAETYRNRKQIFSLNVQAITNADMYITNIVARWPGSSHDSHIFNSSVIKGRLENGEFAGFWLLGDKGYAVKKYLLTPLRNPVTQAEQLYNESHIRTRNVVERTFGCWKKRFPALAWKLRTDTRRAQCAIVAMAVLHNMSKKFRDPMPSAPNYTNDSPDSSDDEELYTNSTNDEHNRDTLINNYFGRL